MDGVAKFVLVVEQALELVEAAACAILDEGAPQVDELLCRWRRRLAGQSLPHHQGHGLFDRRIGPIGDLLELAPMEAVVDHRGEVVLHAEHTARTDRLDASLLDGVEHGAGLLATRNKPAVNGRIVTGELQRHRVGVAADDGGLLPGQLAGRLR